METQYFLYTIREDNIMDILPEIKNRKSPLIFQEREVERGKIELLMEAARWAPSCSNNQSWNYVFVHKNDDSRRNLEKALSRGNSWAKKAPYLVVVGSKPEDACDTNMFPYYFYDAGLSVMSLAIEAEHQGLRVRQMAGWKEDVVKKAVGFDEDHVVIVLFALGYEENAERVWDSLDERMRERVSRPRTRKPTKENFFFRRYGDH
jgi:nitroreductase